MHYLKNYCTLLLFIFPVFSQAVLLDKVSAIIDSRVITLSEIRRIQNTISARKVISPQIYQKDKYNQNEISDILINESMIREKLNSMGYVITDEQVEDQIRSTEKRLNLNRDALMQFLKTRGLTFEEYFEIIRSTIEYNIFVSRVIQPLISITEQEIKNEYYKENLKNKALSFKYTLVDFTIPKKDLTKKQIGHFRNALKKFQINGNLPSEYKNVETNVLGDIGESGLTKQIKTVLKKTQEGTFTSAVSIGSHYHVFFVKKKDLVESENYLQDKNRIKEKLFKRVFSKVTKLWFQRETNKHFVKKF